MGWSMRAPPQTKPHKGLYRCPVSHSTGPAQQRAALPQLDFPGWSLQVHAQALGTVRSRSRLQIAQLQAADRPPPRAHRPHRKTYRGVWEGGQGLAQHTRTPPPPSSCPAAQGRLGAHARACTP